MSYGSPLSGQGTVPPPSAPGISGVLPGQQAVNTTRILSLTGFSKDLKTRDIQTIFVDWEDDRGGYRIKWLDDTGCLIIFNDPIAAKRAFLSLLANPHPHLLPSTTTLDGETVQVIPRLAPYKDQDASQIIASVANRPRSRSIASNNATSGNGVNSPNYVHGRRMSNSGANNFHGRMVSSVSSGSLNGTSALAGARHLGRGSLSQNQMQAIIDDSNSGAAASEPAPSSSGGSDSPSSPTAGNNMPSGGAIDWNQHQAKQESLSRSRNNSGSAGQPGFTSPPVSPERSLGNGGAVSPTRLRRVIRS